MLGLIQENSIENSVQHCLSYIPKTVGLYSTTLEILILVVVVEQKEVQIEDEKVKAIKEWKTY